MYNVKVIKHFENPLHTGEIENADGVAVVGNPECGDMMKLYIRVKDGRVVDARFKTFGCAAAIATSSVGAELIIGRTLEEAELLTAEEIVDELGGLPEKKIHCSTLMPLAIKAAVADFRARRSGSESS